MARLECLLLAILLTILAPHQPGFAQSSAYKSLQLRWSEHFEAGRMQEAAALAKDLEAASIAAFGAGSQEHADTLHNLATVAKRLSRFAEAEGHYRRTLEIRERLLGAEHPHIADVVSDLATLYDQTDRQSDAEAAYKRALAIDRKHRRPDDPLIIGTLNNVAILLTNQARFGEAEDLLRQSLALIAGKSDQRSRSLTTNLLNTLGSVYLHQLRYAEAEPLLARSLALKEQAYGKTHPEVALGFSNLSHAVAKLGRRGEAIALLKRAVAIEEGAYGRESRNVASSLMNIGTIEVELGQLAEAEPRFRQALRIFETVLGPRHSDVSLPLQNLGDVVLKLGRSAEAEPILARALELRRAALGDANPGVAQTLSTLSDAAAARGDLARAVRLDREATAGVVARAAATSGARRRGVAASPLVQQSYVFDRALKNFAAAAASSQGEARAELGREAFIAAQWPTQSLAGSAIQQMAARFAEGDGTLARLVRASQDLDTRWLAAETRFRTAVASPGSRDTPGGIREEMAAIEREQAAVGTRIEREFPTYAALTRPSPVAVADLQRLLAPSEALLFLHVGREQTTVFAVSPTEFAWHGVPIRRQQLAELVVRFRAGLETDPGALASGGSAHAVFDPGVAHDLFKLLLGPVDRIAGGAANLLVVPTGSLTSVPFHLLVTEPPPPVAPGTRATYRYSDVSWLLKRQATTVLPTVASLAALRSLGGATAAPEPLIGFADPQFQPKAPETKAGARRKAGPGGSKSAPQVAASPPSAPGRGVRAYGSYFRGANTDTALLSQSLVPLPETADEVREVARRLGAPATSLRLGATASETTVKGLDLSRYRVVYFATHGLVAGELGGFGEPALALTIPPSPTPADDGLLTATEIAALKLAADWVVLSACNTAAGSEAGAEALSGLARSFFYAGARALLVTHWAVDSEAAVRLTTGTFAALASEPGIGRAEALRRAMLTLLSDTSAPVNAYPGTWAPFVVVGEGGSPR
ncbi:MAG: CHAT domain-containing tetratricopeptide repeat protein [Hyphomicrobiaceae bacterium]|nr:CHAT domain-containing tetratricopeptide repeat protein [Hyphomicrobiaceae bacterium]